MKAEYEGLKTTGTFVETEVPKGRKPVTSKWVFKWKVNEFGEVVKPKCRLVARGFTQVPGVDYDETFSPTPQASSVRLLITIALREKLDLLHFDAERAFVQSKLNEELYMKLPPGCNKASGQIVKLARSIYGLKQAGRCWHTLLVQQLESFGLEQCPADPCIFRKTRKDGRIRMMLAVHVDDMVVAGNSADCNRLHKHLNKRFPTNNLGPLTHYTGCNFKHDKTRNSITICQETYIERLVERFNITKSCSLPAATHVDASRREKSKPTTQPFREAVGALMWLANTSRPDIANAVRSVARRTHDATEGDWDAVLKILGYLRGTKTLGLTLTGKGGDLVAYADSNYATDREDRKSVSGGAIMYGDSCISWFSRTQKCVSTSSSEAEYVSMAECAKEAMFVRYVLGFLTPGKELPSVVLREDNKGAICLAQNPLSSGRTKHIDVRYHFVRDLAKKGVVEIKHVSSARQHADTLTKPLGKSSFWRHRDFLLNVRNK